MKIVQFLLTFSIGLIMSSCGSADLEKYRGTLGRGGGEYPLGQSTWQYNSGKVIAYGGDRNQIFYILFSEVPLSSFTGADYPPDTPGIKTGGFEFIKNEQKVFFPFTKNTLIITVDIEPIISAIEIELSKEDFQQTMQAYANSIKDEDYENIYKIIKTKIL